MTQYDAVVIGTGQAGPSLAARLAGDGMKVAVIERHQFGGTCVNTGCTPTKTLVASARAAHMARRAADFGINLNGDVSVDMKKVKARKDEIAGASTKGVENWLKGLDNSTVYEGHARLESPRTVRVGDEVLESPRIFINVGGRAAVPPMPGLDEVDYLTNSTMMDLDVVPEHLVIIGGSYIGLEFGQMYRRFGSEVTIVEMGPGLIQREDDDISDEVRQILAGEGVEIRLDAECITAGKDGDGIRVGVDCETGDKTVTGTHLLLAVGRRPNTDDLGLDAAGVKVDEQGYIVVDDQLRTNVPGIWALGDCNGRGAFTHTSYNDYEIVAANLLDDDPRRVSDRFVCYGLFIDPPLGRVGMTETEVRASGRPVLVGKRPMTNVARAREKGETQGFMKITVDADSKEILGAAILGVGGDEAIHCIADVMYAKAPYTVIQRAVHIHPTVSELIPTMLGELEPLT
jgi:pyruvate/2-oxoglutarate dehydrogenase complex dihydrolipoamide dehydrogenase (E3) component